MSYIVKPEGLLFFRDARPLDVDKASKQYRAIGHGANWPRPDHFYNAIMHGLINQDANAQWIVSADGKSHYQFGGLQTKGPFPIKEGKEFYFPRPLDVDMSFEKLEQGTNMPEPLEYGFVDRKEGKKKYSAWISASTYKEYLQDNFFCTKHNDGLVKKIEEEVPLFDSETLTGTTLDPKTGASKRVEGEHASGQYQGEYLRLKEDVDFWCDIELKNVNSKIDIPQKVKMGGQGGVVSCMEVVSQELGLEEVFEKPVVQEKADGKIFVRWTLLTPAYFSQTGWLPGFCKDTTKNTLEQKPLGVVMLPEVGRAKLVGACVGKPIYFSGWDTKDKQKPTILCVPAGSAYVFECENSKSANNLIEKLHLQRRSDLGSQGYGIGVCSFFIK